MVAVVTGLWGAEGQARSSTAAEVGGLAGLGVPVQLGRLLRGEDPPLLGHLDLARFHSCRCARSAAHTAADVLYVWWAVCLMEAGSCDVGTWVVLRGGGGGGRGDTRCHLHHA